MIKYHNERRNRTAFGFELELRNKSPKLDYKSNPGWNFNILLLQDSTLDFILCMIEYNSLAGSNRRFQRHSIPFE